MRFGHSLIELEMLKLRNSRFTDKEEHYPNIRRYVGKPRDIDSIYHIESLNPVIDEFGNSRSAFVAGISPMDDDHWVN